jgi:hypothetical protein
MKKSAILFIALAATVMTNSCTEEEGALLSAIQGTWSLTAQSKSGEAVMLDGCELGETTALATTTGNVTLSDDDLQPRTFETVHFTFTQSGDNLNVTLAGPGGVLTILCIIDELTSLTLRLRLLGDSEEGAYDPANVTSQTFTKQ